VSHYRHVDHPNDFKGDWITRYAWYMISKKHGHCKNFAAALCVIFRSYGYDARVVTGYVPSRSRGWAEHGWVEATIKGKTYIFDPSYGQSRGMNGWYKRTYKNALIRYRLEKRW
jgi:transglutaminase-like putative cysteine protease